MPRAIALGVALITFLTGPGALARAQEVSFTAILQEGPELRRGIDELAPDATPHWYGTYAVAGAVVEVRYVSSPLERTQAWPLAVCDARELRQAGEPGDRDIFAYTDERGWSLLISVVRGELPPQVSVCSFTDRFVARHLLFHELEGVRLAGDAPVFPAVINL